MTLAVPMPISTPRLLIRPPLPGDGVVTAAAIAETWADLHRWMLWADCIANHTAELQEVRSRHVAQTFLLRQELNMVGVEIASGQPVVWTGFHALDWTDHVCETGFWVRKGWQGQGLATEACNALVRYAFGALGMREVRIAHADGNAASERVIRKVGFVPRRVELHGSALPEGRAVDKHWYARESVEGIPELEVRWGEVAVDRVI